MSHTCKRTRGRRRRAEEAQRRKRTWPQRPRYAVLTLVLIGSALAYALSVNLLSMFEGTMCLRFAGGSGCGEDG